MSITLIYILSVLSVADSDFYPRTVRTSMLPFFAFLVFTLALLSTFETYGELIDGPQIPPTGRISLEADILQFAENKGGTLTIVDILQELSIDIETAKDVLDSLIVQGIAQRGRTASGLLTYTFLSASHVPQKDGS